MPREEEDVGTTRALRGGGGPPRAPARVRRQIVEHLTKARQVPAVTFAEECDFTDTDVNLLVPLALQAAAARSARTRS